MIKLLHGDCLELMKNIPDNSIDMVLCDPPYGTSACKWDSVIPFEPMWRELKRVIKENGAICLFGSEPFSSHLRLSNLKMFKYDWIWDKKNISCPFLAKKRPLPKHEIISVFSKKPHNYYPIKTDNHIEREWTHYNKGETQNFSKTNVTGNKGVTKGKYPKSIIEFSNSSRKKIHPTQKPVALLEYLIKTYTLDGETILHFASGSASTGVAAKNLNRKCILIEKDDKYFKIGKERIKNG